MPLTQIHPQAFVAAEAARCAWDQDAYMAMHDKLFNTQAEWNGRSDAPAIFNTYAEELGLDVATFNECMESHQHQDAISEDLQEGINLGIRGTPTFTVNGTLIFGAQPLSAFEQAISQALAESGEQ
jgi:protein-disulfide isomerase